MIYLVGVFIFLCFLDLFVTGYLMFWSNEQQIKDYWNSEKYEKLFEDSFLYGVVIIPFILIVLFIIGAFILDKI